MPQSSTEAGVTNMLRACAGLSEGQTLLIAYEPPEFGYFDADVVNNVALQATRFGLLVDKINVGFRAEAPAFSRELRQKMTAADATVFLARMGDQLRFSDVPKGGLIVNSYTVNQTLLESAFAAAPYDAFVALKAAVDRVVASAREFSLTCPRGTSVRGQLSPGEGLTGDTTIKRFPMSIFSPVSAAAFSGKVALAGFLTGTGSRYYDPYTVEFEAQVFAKLEGGRLSGFDGNPSDVAKANAQYDHVSQLFGIARNVVHSWHAGIHPGCGFPWDAAGNYEIWSGVAFGNPRILHFHTCGAYAPGEISWNVLDPTIEIDGIPYWRDGQFQPQLLAEGGKILESYPFVADLFETPTRQVGLDHKSLA